MKVCEIKINKESYVANKNETIVIVKDNIFGSKKIVLDLINTNDKKTFFIDKTDIDDILSKLFDVEYFELKYTNHIMYAAKNSFNFFIDNNVLKLTNGVFNKTIPLAELNIKKDITNNLKTMLYSDKVNSEGTGNNFRYTPFISEVKNGRINVGNNIVTIHGYNFSPDTTVELIGNITLVNSIYVSPVEIKLEVEAIEVGHFDIILNNMCSKYTKSNAIVIADYTTKKVEWNALINCKTVNNKLQKTNSRGWNAGAISKFKISKDNIGYIEFALNSKKRYMIGFSYDSNANQSYGDIDFAYYSMSGRSCIYFKWRRMVSTYPHYNMGDICKIELTMSSIIWYVAGVEIYRTDRPNEDLYVDTSLYDTNTIIEDVTIFGILIK